MSLQYTTSDGQTLIVPGAYAQAQVVAAPSSVAANGILMVLGEADSGPSYAEESDITLNVFGPDQKADIVAKYGSGALVDAYVGAVTASKDDNIKGSFTRFIPIKTNMSVKSSTTLPAVGGGTYANLFAKSAGKPGNLITRTIKVNLLEQVPVIGPLLLASPQVVTDLTSRVNGGAGISIGGSHLAVGATPTAMVSAMAALTGTTTSGGVARVMIDTTRSVTTSNVVGFSVTFTATTNFAHSPVVGDILFIPTGSQFATANEGTYVVQSAGSNIFTALKVIDAAGTGFSRTAPTIETVAAAAAADIESFSPVTISVTAGAVVPGLGKSLELANNSLVAGLFSDLLWAYNPSTLSVSRYGVVSTSAVPFVITSPQEYQVDLNVVRQKDGISEDIVAGGSPVLSFGYVGTTASAVVANGTMVLTLAGGVSSSLSPITITLSDFPTIGDLCQYLNSLGGFTASPTLATYSSISPPLLDAGTYSFATTWGAQTGRIKTDGSDFLSAVNAQSVLVNISPAGIATNLVGLPDIVSLGFLSGGSRGASSNASIQGGLDILQAVKGNLVIPLFSNDSGIDIASGFTDPTSVYDIKSITSLTVFRPWMAAVKAAAMQAAGFYKDITHKYTSVSSATVPGGGFNYNINSNLEDGLNAGLLMLINDDAGFKWVSDQTTYSVDSNFVFNSLQAMYVLDIIMATSEQRMERAFVGQSLADVSATTAVTVFKAICDDMIKLKLIAPSDDAPRGVKNIVIKIVNGNAMVVGCEIKEATSLKFVSIQFMVSAIQQSASG